MDTASLQNRIFELEREIARLHKVNTVLMHRVEKSLDNSGDAFSLFESNILLQKTIEERTRALQAEVAERERAEQELLASRQKLLMHIKHTPLGVIEWDSEMRVVEWNDAAEEIFGYSREEVIGGKASDLILPPDQQEMVEAGWERILTERKGGVGKNDNVCKNGRRLTCEWYYTPLIDENDNVIGVATLVQDITERVQNDREKKARMERIQRQRVAISSLIMDTDFVRGNFEQATKTVLEIASDALNVERASLWFFDEEYTCLRCVDLYSASKKEHSTGVVLECKDYPTYFKAVQQDRVVACNNAQTDALTREFTETYLAPLNITSMLDVAFRVPGKLVGVICNEHTGEPRTWKADEITFADEISSFLSQVYLGAEQRRSERQQKELQERLERAERMESLGIMAGGVAHDLNNTLGPVVGYTDLILSQLDENDKVAKRVKKIGKSAQDAADVIQDLLTLARRGRYEMMPLNLNTVVKEYLESPGFLRLFREREDVAYKIDLDKSIGKIMGSTSHLNKVVMNLVVNACDAMPDGGRLIIQTRQAYVRKLPGGYELDNDAGEYIIFSVIDTGKGISAEDLEKIFEPYYSKKKMGGSSGSGLGLSVVYGVVKDHKGYYDISSTPGKGTNFSLYFPVTTDLGKTSNDKADEAGGTETILVVDDNESQREVAAELLEALGYKVLTASSGKRAVDLLKSITVDLVVMDMIMDPGIDGLDTYREILKIHPGQKAIIASGYSATDRVEKMQELGAGEYIKKPFTLQKLRRVIREELNKESARA